MAGGTDGESSAVEWPCEVLFEAQRALSAVASLDEVAAAVTQRLVDSSLARLSWVRTDTTAPERVQVVALNSASLTVERESVPVDGGALPDGVDRVRIGPTVEHPEYRAVAGTYDLSQPSTTVAIPVANDEEEYGVLIVCTERDVLNMKDRLSVVGRAIADRCLALERAAALDRERQRIETVRSRVSHDLGNPVNIASGRLELASDECDSPHIKHAIDGLAKIESLADETVTFVEAGKQPEGREQRQIEAVVREAWQRVNPQQATLEVADGAIYCDPEQTCRLAVELLENAREHSRGTVTVTAGPLEDRSGFFVADDGPGIPPDEREAVFDLGYATGDRAGTGLAVVAEIVAAHGWTVALSESERGGTRIECRTDRI